MTVEIAQEQIFKEALVIMCGRYFLALTEENLEIIKIIGQVNERYKDNPLLDLMKTGEIFPTNIAPVLTAGSAELMGWGFSRFDGKGRVINARAETVTEKPMFRRHFFMHRCLIPVTYYFEWENSGGKKNKYAIALRNPFFMAGLYRHEKDLPLPTFVIITRPAVPELVFIHDRMPVLVSGADQQEWLNNADFIHEALTKPPLNLNYWQA
jgi:putative SOS response-associated peptidase YedK